MGKAKEYTNQMRQKCVDLYKSYIDYNACNAFKKGHIQWRGNNYNFNNFAAINLSGKGSKCMLFLAQRGGWLVWQIFPQGSQLEICKGSSILRSPSLQIYN